MDVFKYQIDMGWKIKEILIKRDKKTRGNHSAGIISNINYLKQPGI